MRTNILQRQAVDENERDQFNVANHRIAILHSSQWLLRPSMLLGLLLRLLDRGFKLELWLKKIRFDTEISTPRNVAEFALVA